MENPNSKAFAQLEVIMKTIKITQNSISGFGAKAFLSIATALLLLLSARGSVFADSTAIFTDATLSAGLNTTGFTFGNPIWGDFDNDGDLDLFVDNHYNAASYLYQNNGNGTFTDIRPVSGLKPAGDRHGSAWVDFDNDGDLDLSVTKGARHGHAFGTKQDELYQDLGASQFANIAEAAGV